AAATSTTPGAAGNPGAPGSPGSAATSAPGGAVADARRLRLGEALVEDGVLTREQLNAALAAQKTSGRILGELLVEQGVAPGIVVKRLARSLGVRGCQLRHGLADPSLIKEIGDEELQKLKALPLFKVHGVLTVAMAEPQSLPTIDRLRQLTGCRINAVLALESVIVEYIKKYATG